MKLVSLHCVTGTPLRPAPLSTRPTSSRSSRAVSLLRTNTWSTSTRGYESGDCATWHCLGMPTRASYCKLLTRQARSNEIPVARSAMNAYAWRKAHHRRLHLKGYSVSMLLNVYRAYYSLRQVGKLVSWHESSHRSQRTCPSDRTH